MVQVSINQFSSFQFPACGPDPFKSLTPVLCLFPLELQLSSLTQKVTLGQVQVQSGSIIMGFIVKLIRNLQAFYYKTQGCTFCYVNFQTVGNTLSFCLQ